MKLIKQSLVARIVILSLALIAVSFIVLTSMVVSRMRTGISKVMDERCVSMAEADANKLNSWFMDKASALRTMAYSFETGLNIIDQRRLLRSLADSSDDITDVYVGNDKNEYIFANWKDIPDDYDVASRS